MPDDTPLPFALPSVCRKKLTVDFNGGNQSSNGGLLLLREKERALGVCRRLADAMPDRRDADRIRHAMFEMVTARVAAIACGYEDANDLDRLRHDPLMKLVVGRCPQSGEALASQSTISRLENAPRKTEAARLCAALIDQFGTTVKPGRLEILDIDDTFCAAHGGQQLAFWNAHHDERGFAPMHIYHVASGTPVVAILRAARTPKGTEVRTVIKHVTKRLRKHWPNTRTHVQKRVTSCIIAANKVNPTLHSGRRPRLVNPRALEHDLDSLAVLNVADDPTRFKYNPNPRVCAGKGGALRDSHAINEDENILALVANLARVFLVHCSLDSSTPKSNV